MFGCPVMSRQADNSCARPGFKSSAEDTRKLAGFPVACPDECAIDARPRGPEVMGAVMGRLAMVGFSPEGTERHEHPSAPARLAGFIRPVSRGGAAAVAGRRRTEYPADPVPAAHPAERAAGDQRGGSRQPERGRADVVPRWLQE